MVSKKMTSPSADLRRFSVTTTAVVTLLLCAIAGAVIYFASDFPATAIETDIGAGAFPMFYASVLILLALALLWGSLRRAPQAVAEKTDKMAWFRTATGVALMLVYIVLMSYVGYLVTTPLFLICIMVLMGYRRPVLTPSIAALMTGILWLLFVEALQVPLPVGSLFE